MNKQTRYGTDAGKAAQDVLKMWSKRVTEPDRLSHLDDVQKRYGATRVKTLKLYNKREPVSRGDAYGY